MLFLTDINSISIECATETIKSNGFSSRTNLLLANLFDTFRIETKFDIILFNPPYVCTEDDEYVASQQAQKNDNSIFTALSGGQFGMNLVEKFLAQLPQFLAENGWCYLVLIDRNQPEKLIQILPEKYRLSGKILLQRRCGIEKLYVLKISHSDF